MKSGTNDRCPNGTICDLWGGAGGGTSGGNGGTYVSPITSPPSCGMSVSCTYANGVATIKLNESSGVSYNAHPPHEWVYTRVVYAKGCVGAERR